MSFLVAYVLIGVAWAVLFAREIRAVSRMPLAAGAIVAVLWPLFVAHLLIDAVLELRRHL